MLLYEAKQFTDGNVAVSPCHLLGECPGSSGLVGFLVAAVVALVLMLVLARKLADRTAQPLEQKEEELEQEARSSRPCGANLLPMCPTSSRPP